MFVSPGTLKGWRFDGCSQKTISSSCRIICTRDQSCRCSGGRAGVGCWGERRRLRRYLTMFSPASVNVMPPADGKRVGVANFYNVGDVAWRAYAVDPSLNRFDPQRGADHARAYATKYASKPETGGGRSSSLPLAALSLLGALPPSAGSGTSSKWPRTD